jgi:hypothetical protein
MSAHGYPARPPSEVEWEELLVRYEIAPRAVQVALGDASAVDEHARQRTGDLLRGLLANELQTAALFAAMREQQPFAEPIGPAQVVLTPASSPALAARFGELRGRNFAAMQRRGLEVWEWRTSTRVLGEVTAYQLILRAVELDASTLAALREAGQGAAC